MSDEKPRIEIVEDDPKAIEAAFLAFKDKVFEAARESIEWCTAPLINYFKDKPPQHRTGVLLQLGDLHFLVTAAHDLIEFWKEGSTPHVILPEKGLLPVPLKEEFQLTKDSKEDLAVAQLDPDTVVAMGHHFRYFRLTDVMRRDDPRQGTGFYLLFGYPFALVRPDDEGVKRTDHWKYLTTPYDGDVANITNFDPHLHLVLAYDRVTQAAGGLRVHPPGLSGCGIWFVGRGPDFNADEFKLVGIQTAWHKGFEYAKGTWIDVVLVILWKHFPDARSVLKLHGFSL